MSDHVHLCEGGTVTVGCGALMPDNRCQVLIQVNAASGGAWVAVVMTWSEARKVAAAILARCGGPFSDEEGGHP